MPPATESLNATNFTIDRASHSIQIARKVAADRSGVLTAWTDPRQVELWWDPAGEPLERCEIDLRVGGTFTFVNQGHSAMPFCGVYREITPPERLVFEAMGSLGEVLLTQASGGTRIDVTISCSSNEQLEQFIEMGVAIGTSQTLDNLVSYMKK